MAGVDAFSCNAKPNGVILPPTVMNTEAEEEGSQRYSAEDDTSP
jgi:hypothetical protein